MLPSTVLRPRIRTNDDFVVLDLPSCNLGPAFGKISAAMNYLVDNRGSS